MAICSTLFDLCISIIVFLFTIPIMYKYLRRSKPDQSNSNLCISVIVFLFTIPILYKYLRRSKPDQSNNNQKRAELPPGPKPWPLIGNLPELVLKKPTHQWIHLLMKDMNTEIACIRFGSVHVIPIICPKIAQEVMRKNDAVFASRPMSFASNMFSGGYKTAILSPYGDQWMKMRRVLTTEIICPDRHRWLHDKRTKEADHLLRYVYNQCEGNKLVNLRDVTRHYCGNVIRMLVFNKRYFGNPMPDGRPGADEIEHIDALFKSHDYLYAFSVSDYFPKLIGFDLDGHEKIVKEVSKTFQKLHDPIIVERIRLWKENEKHGEKQVPQDFLDVLISLCDQQGNSLLTPDEIKAQTTEMMITTVDNPSNVVEWILAEMMDNHEILEKAKEEIGNVVGMERLVQESDIPQLNYLKACIREAFRLHPIKPFNLPHVSMEDSTIAGYFIPKGSHVLISRLGLGRNTKIWEEPLLFKPERHLNTIGKTEVVLTEPDLRFISFSTGRRGCIAPTLGTVMSVMLLARLIQGFNWSKPFGVSSIDRVESEKYLFRVKPLVLQAEPSLNYKSLYPA